MLALTGLAFAPAIAGSFHLDDYSILNDPILTSPAGGWMVWRPAQVRPLSYFTLWANYMVSGASPLGYHLVNWGIHLVNVALAWLALSRLASPRVALVATALFALHPVQTESVAYVFARSTLLCSGFCLASLAAWVRGRHWWAVGLHALAMLSKEEAVAWPVVLAHLGNGASVAAVRDGRSIDTSMALTPAAGLVMGSRSGDLDPGLFGFLARTEQMTVEQFANLINRESGMLGISELSADMRELLQLAPRDERAAQAVEVFCYQARKWIAAMAAALGGIDLLVFSGGIGENVPVVRERICDGLGFLGVGVDHARNQAGEPIISPDPADVRVRVIATDEELMIAQQVYARWAAALDFRH